MSEPRLRLPSVTLATVVKFEIKNDPDLCQRFYAMPWYPIRGHSTSGCGGFCGFFSPDDAAEIKKWLAEQGVKLDDQGTWPGEL